MSGPLLPEPSGREPSAAELATANDPRLGIAYAVNVRNEGGGENSVAEVIMTYRLHRRAPNGVTLPALQVEMRGWRLQGMIAEGDLIQAPTPLPPTTGVIRLESVTNLTTGAPVALAKRTTSGCAAAALIVLVILVVLFIAGIIVSFLVSS